MKKMTITKILTCFIGISPISTFLISCTNQIEATAIWINVPEEIFKDQFYMCTANVEPAGANQNVIWSVSDNEIAEIDPTTGQFAPKKTGTITIFATSVDNPHLFTYKNIEIKAIPEKISIVGDKTIAVGSSQKYSATIEPAEASQNFTWNLLCTKDIAVIDENGVLTVNPNTEVGKKLTLIAKSENEKIDYAQIVIETKAFPTNVEISSCPDEISIGSEYECTATCEPKKAKQDVIWSTSDEQYAIFKDGKLIGKKPGYVDVIATSVADKSICATKQVRVLNGTVATDFTTDSWETVSSFLNDGIDSLREAYKNTQTYIDNGNTFVGLEKTLVVDSIPYHVRVVGEGHDEIFNSGGKKAALTFEFVEDVIYKPASGKPTQFLTEFFPKTPDGYMYWYNDHTELGSPLYNFLNTTFLEWLNYGMGFTNETSIIKTVIKQSYGYYDDKDPEHWALMESHDKIFLPSITEVLDENLLSNLNLYKYPCFEAIWDAKYLLGNEGPRYEWYANNKDIEIKECPKDPLGKLKLEKYYPGVDDPSAKKIYVFFRTVTKVSNNFGPMSWHYGNLIRSDRDGRRSGVAPFFCI